MRNAATGGASSESVPLAARLRGVARAGVVGGGGGWRARRCGPGAPRRLGPGGAVVAPGVSRGPHGLGRVTQHHELLRCGGRFENTKSKTSTALQSPCSSRVAVGGRTRRADTQATRSSSGGSAPASARPPLALGPPGPKPPARGAPGPAAPPPPPPLHPGPSPRRRERARRPPAPRRPVTCPARPRRGARRAEVRSAARWLRSVGGSAGCGEAGRAERSRAAGSAGRGAAAGDSAPPPFPRSRRPRRSPVAEPTAEPSPGRRALVAEVQAAAPAAARSEIMNPVYSPGSSGVPYANAKGIGYPAGFPMGYAAAAPAYSPNMYPGANPTFQTGYTPGTPYKVSCSPTSGAVPPYSSSPNPYQTAVYPVRSAYPQQSPYAQQGTYYTQPLYAAPPHVIHHTTVVQPNGMPATVYPAPIPPPRGNGVTMGMVAGTTMAMSAVERRLSVELRVTSQEPSTLPVGTSG
uniref:Family with sequence similarity 168 member B n=1 Tax=Canis lupus familiaris TaxID=9615 RepID=A0A8C0N0V6_CANLF